MKNEKGISLIALIITIIVIIILAAIVIGSVLNAPDQANFAKYCQDYSEIQSAVSTQGALVYGELATADFTVTGLNMPNVYAYVCKTTNAKYKEDKANAVKAENPVEFPLGTAPAAGKYVPITNQQDNLLGLSSIPTYVKWYVDASTGTVYSSPFSYDTAKYYTSTLSDKSDSAKATAVQAAITSTDSAS